MTDRIVGQRGYGLGERDPEKLPGARAGNESHDENVRRTKHWRQVLAWATRPGGKYAA